jgi:hypothetical protein
MELAVDDRHSPDSISLDEIACRFGTDKSTLSRLPPAEDGYPSRPAQGHGYTVYYEQYLRHLRSQAIRLLEIGVLDGKSLATWSAYFPWAAIYGLDIDPSCSRFENDRIKVFVGSQADSGLLAHIRNTVPEGFDVIIDDGSHYIKHVKASFYGLFDHVKFGGTYVIEDLHVSNWRDWGKTSFNRGMDLEKVSGGNDAEEMFRFLSSVRGRNDVAELVVHLKKICFIRKAATAGTAARSAWDRGDRLEDLFPIPRKRNLIQKIAARLMVKFSD